METQELTSFPHLEKVLEDYAVAVRNLYQDNLIRAQKIASGELLNKVDFAIKVEGSVYEVGLNLMDYWKYVEYGRRAGAKFPPPDVIREWIKVKPVLPRPIDGKLPTLEQLTYLISRSIAENGIKPTHALRQAQEVSNEEWMPRIASAFMEDIKGKAQTFLSILTANY